MKLVAIIVNYKTPEMTLDAAKSAIKQLINIRDGWRLIIVDNDSRDNSFEILNNAVNDRIDSGDQNWRNVEVMQSGRNGGFGAGNNFGIRKHLGNTDTPEYFYILNSDAFPDDRSVQQLVDYLDHHADAGIAGSYIHGVDNDPHVTAFRFPTMLSEFEGSIRLGLVTKFLQNFVVPIGIPPSTQTVDWLAGASMLIRKDVLERIGLFDENFFLYFEETDLCNRAKKAGWSTVYVTESSVTHIGSASTGMKSWERIPTYWLDSRRHYFIKNHGHLYFYIATFVRILGESLWKIRVKIEKKSDTNPTGLVSDLIKHMFSPYSAQKY